MKIIADMGKNKYLAEVDSFELRDLDSETELKIGAKFDIRKAAETLAVLRNLNRTKLEYVGRYINDLQTKFEQAQEAYDAVMMLDIIKHNDGE